MQRRYLDKMRSNESHIYETTPEKENGGVSGFLLCKLEETLDDFLKLL